MASLQTIVEQIPLCVHMVFEYDCLPRIHYLIKRPTPHMLPLGGLMCTMAFCVKLWCHSLLNSGA